MRPSIARPLALSAVVLGVLASPAAAAQRWVSPEDWAVDTGDCTYDAPCRIDHAVNDALAGDEVIVPSGDYVTTVGLHPGDAVAVHGIAGDLPPRLIGGSALTVPTLDIGDGGSVRDVEILASATGATALKLKHGVAERLVLRSEHGTAAEVVGAKESALLRDSVAISQAPEAGAAAVIVRDSNTGNGNAGGSIALRNVTAYAAAQTGLRCSATAKNPATLVNVIARGAAADLERPSTCATQYSDYRFTPQSGAAGTGDRDTDPRFRDAAAADLHLGADSLLIDAGTGDALLGSGDPDGRVRPLGAAPEIGAYEDGPAPARRPTPRRTKPVPGDGSTPVDGTTPGDGTDEGDDDGTGKGTKVKPPVLGSTVVIKPASGRIVFRAPGAKRFVPLDGSASVPSGSLLDARNGAVSLSTALATPGETQTGTFRGGLFQVRQLKSGKGMTDILLRGDDLSHCVAPAAGKATASAKRKPRRRLWASDDHGQFRTHGRNSVATARGTAWYTEDTCEGTLTRVTEGAVLVKETAGRRRSTLVRAGHSRLTKAPAKKRANR